MPRSAPVCVTLALSAAAFGAAGCGGSPSPADREAAFRTAYRVQSAHVRTLGEQVTAALGAAGSQDDAVVAATFSTLGARANRVVRALRGLQAPPEAQAATARLADAVARAGDDLETIAAAARAGNVQRAAQASQAVVEDSLPIRDARAALDRIVTSP